MRLPITLKVGGAAELELKQIPLKHWPAPRQRLQSRSGGSNAADTFTRRVVFRVDLLVFNVIINAFLKTSSIPLGFISSDSVALIQSDVLN